MIIRNLDTNWWVERVGGGGREVGGGWGGGGGRGGGGGGGGGSWEGAKGGWVKKR